MTVAALHQIAVLPLQKGARRHDSVTTGGLSIESARWWERPPDMWSRIVPYPTLFSEPHFLVYGQYPDGVADMVLRRRSWVESLSSAIRTHWTCNEPNVCFQSERAKATFRPCQLLSYQQDDLLRFLLAEAEDHVAESPLPPDECNSVRVDPDDAIPVHKAYRDKWERTPFSPRLRKRCRRAPCVRIWRYYSELEDTGRTLKTLNRIWEENVGEGRVVSFFGHLDKIQPEAQFPQRKPQFLSVLKLSFIYILQVVHATTGLR